MHLIFVYFKNTSKYPYYYIIDILLQLGYPMLEVESDSAMVVSWIHSQGPICQDYTYLLRWVCSFTFSSLILVSMCFMRLPLLLFFWQIGRVLIVSVGVSLVPRIFPLSYLVFSIWMLKLFLMSGDSVDGFLLPLFFLSYSCVFAFTLGGFDLCFPSYVFILFYF